MSFEGVSRNDLVEPRHFPDEVREGRSNKDSQMVPVRRKGPPKGFEERNLMDGVAKSVVGKNENPSLAGGRRIANEQSAHPGCCQHERKENAGEQEAEAIADVCVAHGRASYV